MTNTIRIALVVLGMQLLVLVVAYAIYFRTTYTDEVFADGEAYGFRIGMSKREVYSELPGSLADMAESPFFLFMNLEVTEELGPLVGELPGAQLLTQVRFVSSAFSYFEKDDTWQIYLDGNMQHSFTFIFCDDALCEIRRHRQYFELP